MSDKPFNAVSALINNILGKDKTLHIETIAATPEWRCNLKCSMCYWALKDEDEYRQTNADPSGSQIADTIASLNPSLVINAGRIQTPKALEMSRRLFELNVPSSIVDNGYWIGKYSPAELQQFQNVSISIDGGPEEHDAWRGAVGAYATATASLLALKGFGLDPTVASVLTSATRKSFPILEQFCCDHDIRMAVGLPIAVHAAENRGFKVAAEDLEQDLRQLVDGKAAKQIILFSHLHPEIYRVAPVLREFTWSSNFDGTSLLGRAAGTATVIEFRPISVVLVTETNIRWDGQAHLSEIVDPAQPPINLTAAEPYLGFWRQVAKSAEFDRKLLDQMNLTIVL